MEKNWKGINCFLVNICIWLECNIPCMYYWNPEMESLRTEGLGITDRLTRMVFIHLEFCSCLFPFTWTYLLFCFGIIFPLELLTSCVTLIIWLLLFNSSWNTVYLAGLNWYFSFVPGHGFCLQLFLLPSQPILASTYPLNSGLHCLTHNLSQHIPRICHLTEENCKQFS